MHISSVEFSPQKIVRGRCRRPFTRAGSRPCCRARSGARADHGRSRAGELVFALPVEVPVADREQRHPPAVGADERDVPALAEQMHVVEHAVDRELTDVDARADDRQERPRVERDRARSVCGRPGSNMPEREPAEVHQRDVRAALRDRVGELELDGRAVGRRPDVVQVVVHLQDQARAGRSRRPSLRAARFRRSPAPSRRGSSPGSGRRR